MGKRMWYVSARVVRNWHQSYQQKGKGGTEIKAKTSGRRHDQLASLLCLMQSRTEAVLFDGNGSYLIYK